MPSRGSGFDSRSSLHGVPALAENDRSLPAGCLLEPVHLGWPRFATPRSRVRFPAGSPTQLRSCPCTNLVNRPDCLFGEEGSIPFAGATRICPLLLSPRRAFYPPRLRSSLDRAPVFYTMGGKFESSRRLRERELVTSAVHQLIVGSRRLMVRPSRFQRGNGGFDSPRERPTSASVAHWIEQRFPTPSVGSSSLPGGTAASSIRRSCSTRLFALVG